MDAKAKLVELYNQQVDWAMKNARLVKDDPEKMKAVHEIFVSYEIRYHKISSLGVIEMFWSSMATGFVMVMFAAIIGWVLFMAIKALVPYIKAAYMKAVWNRRRKNEERYPVWGRRTVNFRRAWK